MILSFQVERSCICFLEWDTSGEISMCVLVRFFVTDKNTWDTQFKGEEICFSLWFRSSEVSVHDGLALRQEYKSRRLWWSKVAHLLVARKQRTGEKPEREAARYKTTPSEVIPTVTCLLQPGLPPNVAHSDVKSVDQLTDEFSAPMIQSPSESPTFEYMRRLGEIFDPNHNSVKYFRSSALMNPYNQD